MILDTSGDPTSELEKFYENIVMDNLDYFRISPEYSRGIYAMEEKLKASLPSSLLYFKHQLQDQSHLLQGKSKHISV